MKNEGTLNERVSDDLEQLLQTQERLKVRIKEDIQFGEAILWQEDRPVLFPRTINVIQGKAGVHKSRLAESMCAAMLKNASCENDLLGFRRNEEESYAVCYVDTERNLSEQLPFALQKIQLKAGYNKQEEPEKFSYISLLEFEREKRFRLLNEYVEHMKKKVQKNLLIVLDVVTDCMYNFNDSKDSLKLIDLMNRSINEHDVTFLCLIHENPGGGEKARGHLGTELINKSTTVLQIGFVKDNNNKETELLKVRYLKCRNSRKHGELYVNFDEKSGGLVRPDQQEVFAQLRSRSVKADHVEMLELLGGIPEEGMKRKELLKWMEEELECNKRTVIKRIKDIFAEGAVVMRDGVFFELKSRMENREVVYFLEEKQKNGPHP